MDCPGSDGRDSRNIFLPLRDLRRTGQGDLVRLAWRTWLVILLPCGLAFPAQAQFKMGESFRNSTAPGWTIAGTDNCGTLGCLVTPLNDDSGILTGGYGNITETQTNDANGNGWLRLTTKRGNQQGRALYTGGSFPSSQGVIVEFDYTIWGGSGADGLTFFLYNATSNMVGAQFGGSLAYCGGAGAYLGVGLDEFGNFSSSAPGVSGGCPQAGGGPGSRPDNVVIRGPASDSYRYITGAAAPSSLDVSPNVNPRPGNSSRVRLSLVPNGSGGYRVSVALGQNGAAVSSNLINAVNFNYAAPANLSMGFGGSTGGLTNVHEVRNLFASTPADIVVGKTVPATALRGRPVTYTLTVRNNDINPIDAGEQSPAIPGSDAPDISDTLPAQVLNPSWTCSATAGSTCPAASGTGNLSFTGGYALAAGGQLTFQITGTLATTASCGATVGNTASAIFSTTDRFSDIQPGDNSATATFTVACPTLVVEKLSQGNVGTFSFSGNNGIQAHAITTTSAGAAVAGSTQTLTAAGEATTITEGALPAGYTLQGVTCTGMGSGGTATVDTANRSVTLNAAATQTTGPITCRFTNVYTPRADLAISKTNNATQLVAGGTTAYVIRVTNNGPDSVTGAVLNDPVAGGLTKVAVACSPTPGQCTAGTTPSVAQLEAGYALPTLANGQFYEIVVTATVTATGQ